MNILQTIFNEVANTHNDAELGAKVRKIINELPATYFVVQEAMKQVAPEVRAPKVVREGKVKPKPRKNDGKSLFTDSTFDWTE